MTTRNFSAIKLPYPKYSINVGNFNLEDLHQLRRQHRKGRNDCNLDTEHSVIPATCLPRFSHLIQLVEVKKVGQASLEQSECRLKKVLCPHLLIENARPELFIRRDFLTKFVDNGLVHISSKFEDDTRPGYRLSTRNNVMILTMDPKQYRRFRLVAKRVKSGYGKEKLHYVVEIDLKNDLIKTSNKYQDKLMLILKRLNSINKIYFRFDPSKSTELSVAAANELAADFFHFVIDEYASDGCQPVPLTGCRKISQTIQKSWLNCSQLHPGIINLDHPANSDNDSDSCGSLLMDDLARNNVENLAPIVDIIDWLGYQLLSLDCGRNEIHSSYLTKNDDNHYHHNDNRVDVVCLQASGIIDYQYAEDELIWKMFKPKKIDQSLILRALFFYSNIDDRNNQICPNNHIILANDISNNDNSGVVYLQDCSRGMKAANEITVIGMSALTDL